MPRSSVSWPRVLAWAVPVLALVSGTVLAAVNTATAWLIAVSDTTGIDTYAGQSVALWPAGLVLLGAGVVSLTATSLVELSRSSALSPRGDG